MVRSASRPPQICGGVRTTGAVAPGSLPAAMPTLLNALRGIADVDADLGRTPADLGAHVATESEPHAGVVHGTRHEVLLDPLLLALPLTRTFVMAAASTGLFTLRLPADAPAVLHELLIAGSDLTPDQATSVVDLTVDALEVHLGSRPDPLAGLAESGHALAALDLAVADAVDDARPGLAAAVELVLEVTDGLTDTADLAEHLGRLGLTETAALVVATDA
jgi:hypothetical protein